MGQRLRVLLVEDDPNDVELVLRELRRAGFDPEWRQVDTEDAFVNSLNPEIQVILSDYSMPQFTGPKALKILQQRELEIPFIIISGTIGESVAVEAMRAGANDYLMKGNLVRLGPTILRELQEAENRRARRIAETALRESEDRYRDLVEHSNDLICTHDLNGRILSVNRTAARALGFDPAALLSMDVREILFSGFQGEYDRYIAELQNTGIAHGLMTVQTKNGQRLVWEYTNTLRTDRVAAPLVRGMAHDVTERVKAEKALRENQLRLAGIVNSAMDAIISVDSGQKIVLFNAAAERIFGCPAGEAIGQSIDRFIPHEFRDRHRQYIRQFGETGVTSRSMSSLTTLTGLRSSGAEFPIEASISQIEVAGETLFTVILRDITERKQLEDQFRQAQKMEAVGRLAGGVAHDFNNMLTAIIGYSQLIKAQLDESSALRHDIEEIEKAGLRAAGLTAQLLAFSRKQVLQPKVLDLNNVISDIDSMLRRLIGEDIELVTVLRPNLGHVRADPGQVEQILLNLAVNSRDAMPRGGKLTIESTNVELDASYVSSRADVLPGRYVMIAVSDTGHGMDAETQTHIFEPFFTTKEQGKGTGLGLSTVFGIVKQSGGHIWIYSEPGHGASFKIYFPRIDDPAETSHVPEETVESLFGSETIMVVEDDESVRRFSRVALEKFGYTVLEAESGAQAIEAFGPLAKAIDLVVTDVIMGGMSGPELVLRLQELHPEVRVLYVSGYTEEATIHHGVLIEGIAFLQKPFAPDGLVRKIREVLDG